MTRPVLTRFQRDVWKNKAVGDAAQVPAAGAVVTFYAQGATASADAYVPVAGDPPVPTPVPVYDVNTLSPNDSIQVETSTSLVLSVVSVDALHSQVYVVNQTASDISILANQRLVRRTGQPPVYSDPLGTVTQGSTLSVPASGQPSGYVAATRFDYIVSGTGVSPARLYPDAAGGTAPNPPWLNILDFGGDLQKSLDVLPACGGEIFLPAGTYVLLATLLINRDNVSLRGQGTNTVITAVANPGFDLVRVEGAFCRISDLKLDGAATTPTAGKSCIVVAGAAAEHCHLKNLLLTGASGSGLALVDSGSVLVMNCESSANRGDGVVITGAAGVAVRAQLVACGANGNQGTGVSIVAEAAGRILLYGCGMRGNGAYENHRGNALEADIPGGVQLVGCRLEWAGSGSAPAQLLRAAAAEGTMVEGCLLDGIGADGTSKAQNGILFFASRGSAVTNTVARNLSQAMVVLDDSYSVVEMGNQDLDSTTGPRIVTGVQSSFFGLSRGVLEPFSDLGPQVLSAPALFWQSGLGKLRVWDGTQLKTVGLW